MRGSTRGSSPTGSRLVMDTGAIMAGLPLRIPGRHATTPSVVGEVRDRDSRRMLEECLAYGRLEVLEPSPATVEEAARIARRAGVLGKLSKTDLEVLALALELRAPVATDDYALQLAASEAGVGFVRIRYRGIREAGSRGGRGSV